jgi:3-hydroxybutyryl-CoA dehydrogenase
MSDSTPLDTPDGHAPSVAVLGAGTMGHGIAQVAALAGMPVRLYDIDQTRVDAGLTKIRGNLQVGVDKGKIDAASRDAAIARLSGTPDLERAAAGVDLVIEAVPERLELKHDVLGRAARHADPRAILGTNTSSLSIAKIAAPLPDPSRVVGMHFFNPVHIMKLLEIVVADTTAPEVVARVRELGAKMGKECITIKDSPGFATSRLGLVIGLEAIRMVEQGVGTAEDIDKAMTLGYGFPMGPLRLTDLVGLDVRLSIAEYLSTALPDGAHFRPPQLLRDMVAQGRLGKKSGRGFYEW